MTIEDFIIKWNGKYIDFDGVYGPQCMDEMHQFCTEVLNITDGSVLASPSAKELWNTFPTVKGHELFEQIANTPTGIPQEGDIMLWTNGTYGHVAEFVEGDDTSFRSFDQNYPTGSPCHVKNHPNYTGVAGWLRFKKNATQTIEAELVKCTFDRNSHWNFLIKIADILQKPISEDVIIPEMERLVRLEDTARQKDKQIATQSSQIAELGIKLQTLQESNEKLALDNQVIQNTVTQQQKLLGQQDTSITELKADIETLKKQIVAPVYKGWKKALIDIIKKI
jgi:cell division protein FtsB